MRQFFFSLLLFIQMKLKQFITFYDAIFNLSIFGFSLQIFVLLFLMLLVGSYTLIERFRRRDREDLYSTEDDELKVYRISLLFCIFSFAVAIGSTFLLPISIISNEVLLLYPNSYYVKWLNSSLIQGLWNFVFLFSNLAIFILLPFAYLFSESTGFLGHKKGIIPRLYETFVVFSLLTVIVIGLIYVLLALFSEKSSFLSILSKFNSFLFIIFKYIFILFSIFLRSSQILQRICPFCIPVYHSSVYFYCWVSYQLFTSSKLSSPADCSISAIILSI